MRLGRVQNFDGKRVQANRHQRLHGIIHKAVAGDPCFAGKQRGSDAHPKVRAKAAVIGPDVARVLVAFVNDGQSQGLQALAQARL